MQPLDVIELAPNGEDGRGRLLKIPGPPGGDRPSKESCGIGAPGYRLRGALEMERRLGRRPSEQFGTLDPPDSGFEPDPGLESVGPDLDQRLDA